MRRTGFNAGGISAVLLLALLLSACGRGGSVAPVINGNTGQRAAPVVQPGGEITVRRGDSLYLIARRYGVGLRPLIDVNRISPPYTIYPGQKLRLPRGNVHVVASGDTVYNVAERYGVEPGALVRANRLAPPFRLTPGQRLALPTAARTDAPQRVVSRAPQTSTSAPPPASAQTKPAAPETQPAAPRTTPPKRTVRRAPPPPSRISPPPAPSGSGFIWPVSGKLLSRFGAIGKGLQNDGINILADRGTPVRAIENGVVAYAGNELRGFGNLLLIKHKGNWISAYAHNDQLLVRTGDTVKRGQVISRVGSTGSVDKPQLHFELRRGNRAVDPEKHLGRRTAAVKGR